MADLTVTAANVVAGSNPGTDTYLAGETITAGQALYLASATKKFMKADNDSGTAEAKVATHIALNGASANQPVVGQKSGTVTIGATMTNGAAYYLSATAGGICPDADVVAGKNVCLIGFAISTTVLSLGFRAPGVTR